MYSQERWRFDVDLGQRMPVCAIDELLQMAEEEIASKNYDCAERLLDRATASNSGRLKYSEFLMAHLPRSRQHLAKIMCGAAIFPGRCDKRAFLEALSMSARESYAELGKWFFVEREADIIFTGHGMDLLRRTDYCGPDLVIPFLIRLAETCRTDPAQSEAVISMVKRTFQLFGDNADDSLSKLLGEIWASQALPSKLLLEDDQVSEYGQAYHLFLCKAETEAALHIFCKGTTINDDTSKQLAFFQYAEASFVRLTDTYQKLCPEDTALLGNIEDMARKATVAARNCRKILELEQLLESLEQQ